MNDNLKAFGRGFIKGIKESPRGFFAPLVAALKWMQRVTDDALKDGARHSPSGH